MPQVEIGKEVNEIEGHEREAEDNTYPFLTSFALKKKQNTSRQCDIITIKHKSKMIWKLF